MCNGWIVDVLTDVLKVSREEPEFAVRIRAALDFIVNEREPKSPCVRGTGCIWKAALKYERAADNVHSLLSGTEKFKAIKRSGCGANCPEYVAEVRRECNAPVHREVARPGFAGG